MNPSKSLEIKVGIVSLSAIILLVLGLSFGKGLDLSPSKAQVKFRFENSGGIAKNAPIMINGVKRGSVVEVTNDNGGVLVVGQLDNIDDLHSDVSARISVLEITGGKKIEIFPGKSATPFSPSGEIKGITSADIADLVTLGGDLSKDATTLVRRIDTIAARASELLADGKVTAQLRQTINETAEMVSTINQALATNMKDINSIVRNIKSITENLSDDYADYEPRIKALVGRLEKIADNSNSLLVRADSALANADKLIGNTNGLVTDVKTGKGFATKLLYDEQFSKSIDSTLISVKALVDQIKQYGINANVRLGSRP